MKRSLFILATLFVAAVMAMAKAPAEIFTKVALARDGHLVAGDSTVILVYAYSLLPFEEIRMNNKKLRVSGASIRPTAVPHRRQTISRIDNRSYYTIICGSYVVTPSRAGHITLPSIPYAATILQEEVRRVERHDPYMAPFEDFFQRPTYKKLKKSGRTKAIKIPVTEAPKKTINQLRREGKTVI